VACKTLVFNIANAFRILNLSKLHLTFMKNYLLVNAFLLSANLLLSQSKINREAVVRRHTVVLTQADTLAALSVGNGRFCFTADVTGLQTFPEAYAKGIPLGTQSEWGWHSFPNTEGYKIEESLKPYATHGRQIPYGVQVASPEHNKLTVNYLRQNPHRLQLGNLGLLMTKRNGAVAQLSDLKDVRQTLDMWTGELKSHFTLEGDAVDVTTFCHPEKDRVSVRIASALMKNGQIELSLRFPYPTNAFLDEANNYGNADRHRSKKISPVDVRSALFAHELDDTRYFVHFNFGKSRAVCAEKKPHWFVITPSVAEAVFEANVSFSAQNQGFEDVGFKENQAQNAAAWRQFWQSGGAVDFSDCNDPRAFELERRVVLSQYLTKIQCAGTMPPQETGLTYNSWFGKPHLEMHWWHGVHFALWGRADLLERQLDWYKKVASEARRIAERQGFEGVRWQKMTDPEGREAPSSVGAFLIWQQPHFITFAELIYRAKNDRKVLEKYKDLVFATADFMASYAYFDPEKQRYILGKALMPAQERLKPEETFNPTYELAYWHWALTTAQNWRQRLGLPPSLKYAEVLEKLSPLPVANGIYLAAESAPDSYTNEKYLTDHPSVLGALGMLPPTKMVNKATMQRTFDTVWAKWQWNDTWGWDFPMAAMTAARLGLREKTVDALLMPIRTNTYLANGHNYQDGRLRLYLPGNGGILAAVAMICAENSAVKMDSSADSKLETPNSKLQNTVRKDSFVHRTPSEGEVGVFPKNWRVRWEGLLNIE
jgi:protein-glucosylgalactosylhydroxylysine glucosidase